MSEELIGGDSLYNPEYRAAQQRLRARSEEAVRRAEEAAEEPQPEVTVVVVDDQDLVRNGFRLILSSYENLRVVGEARNGLEVQDVVARTHPDVVLMDIRMPLMDGIEATRRLFSDPLTADTKVLVLTTFDIDEYVYDALGAGASGFMLKDSEPDEIAHAIQVVARGDALIQPSVMRRLVETFAAQRGKPQVAGGKINDLTEREREVLVMVARGLTNAEIGEQLVISAATVKTHVARIMGKLDVHDRAQLVMLAYEAGLVVPGQS